MALLTTGAFDARQVEPAKPLEPVPTGWYNVKIIESEMKPTSKGDGAYLELTMEILDGDYVGRKAWDRLNLQNPNQTAMEIAYRQLSAICHATGVMQVNDTAQLHGIPLMARIVQKPAGPGADGKFYDASNEVRGYKPQGADGKQPPAGATVAAPPWQQGAGAGPVGVSTPAPAAAASPPWQQKPAPTPAPAQTPAPTGWKPPATTAPPWQKPAPAPVQAPAYPPEAYAWAEANPTDPEAQKILATKPAQTNGGTPKPPWQK
jgi:hypothetical protein